jgi:hypothetical protein
MESLNDTKPKTTWGYSVFGIIAALVSIGAGLYLLSGESAAQESTVFDVLMRGIGAYCVARGLWMIASLRSL